MEGFHEEVQHVCTRKALRLPTHLNPPHPVFQGSVLPSDPQHWELLVASCPQ